jgi:hypothetical protein
MDTMRIVFFLKELYGLSCCPIRKNIRKVYIMAALEFGSSLHWKTLMIDKSLYGLMTSAARFYECLSESLKRLGFIKTKYDPDLWMVDKLSNHEYLAMSMTFLSGTRSLWPSQSHEKDLYVKEYRHSRILFSWRRRIPWRNIK